MLNSEGVHEVRACLLQQHEEVKAIITLQRGKEVSNKKGDVGEKNNSN